MRARAVPPIEKPPEVVTSCVLLMGLPLQVLGTSRGPCPPPYYPLKTYSASAGAYHARSHVRMIRMLA